MNILLEPFKLLVTGPSGSGKSTYVERFIIRAAYRKAFIFDNTGEFAARLKKMCVVVDSTGSLSEAVRSHYRFVSFSPVNMFGGDVDSACEWFCAYVLKVAQIVPGRKLLLLDEAQRFVTPYELPVSLRDCLELGRKHNLHTVLCAHGANTLGPVLRNQLTEVVAFRTTEDNAVKFLRSAGLDQEAVRNLDAPGGYLVKCLRTGRESAGHLFKTITPAEVAETSPTPSETDVKVFDALQ